MDNIRLGIVDDHRLFREGIQMIVSGLAGITTCLEAESGEHLFQQLAKIEVDVILLDLEMKTMKGVEVLEQLRQHYPHIRVIILSMHTEEEMVAWLMKNGALAYLQKDIKKEELELAIRTVSEKGIYFNELVSRSLLKGLQNRNKKPSLAIELSVREKEIMALICEEFTTQEIAEKLFISSRTVEGHRKNIYAKLDVRNTAGLVKKVLQLNLLADQ
jgi:DNA-binding NarL/FixJ family response regulator